MKPPPAHTLFAAAMALLALSGCYPYGPPEKANVPADFPVYPGAIPTSQVYGATSPLPDGSKDRRERYDITWTSDDGAAKLFAYYRARLAQGDWVQTSTSPDSRGGGVIVFNRSSNSAWGGTLYIADGKIHVIMGQDCPCGVPN